MLCFGWPYRKFKSDSDPHNPQKEFKDILLECVGQVFVLQTNTVLQNEKTIGKLIFYGKKKV